MIPSALRYRDQWRRRRHISSALHDLLSAIPLLVWRGARSFLHNLQLFALINHASVWFNNKRKRSSWKFPQGDYRISRTTFGKTEHGKNIHINMTLAADNFLNGEINPIFSTNNKLYRCLSISQFSLKYMW